MPNGHGSFALPNEPQIPLPNGSQIPVPNELVLPNERKTLVPNGLEPPVPNELCVWTLSGTPDLCMLVCLYCRSNIMLFTFVYADKCLAKLKLDRARRNPGIAEKLLPCPQLSQIQHSTDPLRGH